MTHPHAWESAIRVQTLGVREENGIIYLHGEGFIPRDKVGRLEERLKILQTELEKQVGEPVILEIEAIPIDVLNFHIDSNKTNKAGATH